MIIDSYEEPYHWNEPNVRENTVTIIIKIEQNIKQNTVTENWTKYMENIIVVNCTNYKRTDYHSQYRTLKLRFS